MRIFNSLKSGLLLGATLLGVTLALASCSAITNPGKYEFTQVCGPSDASDLQVELVDFQEYEDEMIELRVVRDGQFVMRAVFEGIDEDGTMMGNSDNATSLCVTFSDVLETPGDYSVRTFVDLPGEIGCDPVDNPAPCLNGELDVPAEPGWIDGVSDGFALVDALEASTGFDAVTPVPPGDLLLRVTDMDPHVLPTQHFAMMVLDPDETVVAFARIPQVEEANFEVFIHDVLTPNTTYSLEFYADFIQNGIYDPVPPPNPGQNDHSWIMSVEADGEGNVDETFSHIVEFDRLESFIFEP